MGLKKRDFVRLVSILILAAVSGGIYSTGCSDRSGKSAPDPGPSPGPSPTPIVSEARTPYYLFSAYDGSDYELYLLNKGAKEIIQLTKNATNDVYPVSSGNKLVWKCDNGANLELCASDMKTKGFKELTLPTKKDSLSLNPFLNWYAVDEKFFISDADLDQGGKLRNGIVRYDTATGNIVQKSVWELSGKPDHEGKVDILMSEAINGSALIYAGDYFDPNPSAIRKIFLMTSDGEFKDTGITGIDLNSTFSQFSRSKDVWLVIIRKVVYHTPDPAERSYKFFTVSPSDAVAKPLSVSGNISDLLSCRAGNSSISETPSSKYFIALGDGAQKLLTFDAQSLQFRTIAEIPYMGTELSGYCYQSSDGSKIFYDRTDVSGSTSVQKISLFDGVTGVETELKPPIESGSAGYRYMTDSNNMNIVVLATTNSSDTPAYYGWSPYEVSYGTKLAITDMSKGTVRMVDVGKFIDQVFLVEDGKRLIIQANDKIGRDGKTSLFAYYDIENDKLSNIDLPKGFALDNEEYFQDRKVFLLSSVTCPDGESCVEYSDNSTKVYKLFLSDTGEFIDLPSGSKNMAGWGVVELTDSEFAAWKAASADAAFSASAPIADTGSALWIYGRNYSFQRTPNMMSGSGLGITALSRKKDTVCTWTLITDSDPVEEFDISGVSDPLERINASVSSVFYPFSSQLKFYKLDSTILNELLDVHAVTVRVSDDTSSAEVPVSVDISMIALEQFTGAQSYNNFYKYTCSKADHGKECSILVKAENTGSINMNIQVTGKILADGTKTDVTKVVNSKCRCTDSACAEPLTCVLALQARSSPATWKIRFNDSKAPGVYSIPEGDNYIIIKVTDGSGHSSEFELNVIGGDL